jgi:hypothetical protein
MNNGTILINTGVGFGAIGRKDRKCPPLTASLDYALPIAGLPLTIGLITGFFSEEGKHIINYWPIAGRIGYHFSSNVPHLDPYAFLTIGSISSDKGKNFWMGLSAGAHYFFNPNFGAYAELGFDAVQNLTFGMAFNF